MISIVAACQRGFAGRRLLLYHQPQRHLQFGFGEFDADTVERLMNPYTQSQFDISIHFLVQFPFRRPRRLHEKGHNYRDH